MDRLWYALQVKSRFEKSVEAHLTGQGYEAFVPTYVTVRHWSDHLKSMSLPLFPQYVFCRFDIHMKLPILLIPGVNSVVAMGRTPAPVDQVEIDTMLRVLETGVATRPWPYLKDREMARVVSGPLAGLTGIVVTTKGRDRLIISITLLMRSVSVEIDRKWVSPVNETITGKAIYAEETGISVKASNAQSRVTNRLPL